MRFKTEGFFAAAVFAIITYRDIDDNFFVTVSVTRLVTRVRNVYLDLKLVVHLFLFLLRAILLESHLLEFFGASIRADAGNGDCRHFLFFLLLGRHHGLLVQELLLHELKPLLLLIVLLVKLVVFHR